MNTETPNMDEVGKRLSTPSLSYRERLLYDKGCEIERSHINLWKAGIKLQKELDETKKLLVYKDDATDMLTAQVNRLQEKLTSVHALLGEFAQSSQ